MKKRLSLILVILSFCIPVFFVFAQAEPNEITPELNNSITVNCPEGQVDCYTLLEPIGSLESVDVSADAEKDQGIGGFINFMFEIGIGVAGVMGVVMLVIYGFQYAANDKNIATFDTLKTKITNVILGLLLLLGTFIILNTINPDLLIVSPEISSVLFNIESDSIKDEYGYSVLSGGGSEYDPAGKDDVERINRNINEYDSYFKKYSKQYNVSCNLLKATMYRESGGDPNAKSYVGALGLMQFMPGTARDMGFSPNQMTNPEKAINAAAKYYNYISKAGCNGSATNSVCNASNPIYMTAAYNGGPGWNKPSTDCPAKTVWQCLSNPRLSETRKYSAIVVKNTQTLQNRGWGCES